jgi:hypothetical protein
MVKKVVVSAILAVLLLALQGPGAQADIIALYGPPEWGQGYPNMSISARENIDNGLYGDAGWSGYWTTGQTDRSFNPAPLSYEDSSKTTDSNSSGTSLSSGVYYPGNYLHAQANGTAFSENPDSTASSGITLMFKVAVPCTYHLWGSVTGDNAGVGFTAFPDGAPWHYELDPNTTRGGFDITGLLAPGIEYQFVIGATNKGNADNPGTYRGDWNFDLTAQAATAQAVPVPPSLFLLGSGLLGLGATGLNRRLRSYYSEQKADEVVE